MSHDYGLIDELLRDDSDYRSILIIGEGTHGKDEVARLFRNHGFTFQSSSRAAAEIFIFDKLKDQFGYKTIDECYEDRNTSDEKRKIWYDLICEYNKDDRSRLAKEIMSRNDIYVGLRDRDELQKCIDEKVFDLIIWVDASKRISYREPSTSMNIDSSFADVILDNNGTLEDLKRKVDRIVNVLL